MDFRNNLEMRDTLKYLRHTAGLILRRGRLHKAKWTDCKWWTWVHRQITLKCPVVAGESHLINAHSWPCLCATCFQWDWIWVIGALEVVHQFSTNRCFHPTPSNYMFWSLKYRNPAHINMMFSFVCPLHHSWENDNVGLQRKRLRNT